MIVKLVRPHLSNKEGGRGKPQAFSLLGSCLVKVINPANHLQVSSQHLSIQDIISDGLDRQQVPSVYVFTQSRIESDVTSRCV